MDLAELKVELERLHNASFGWALSCCGHNHAEAEEVLQTVYLKILQNKARFRGESQLRTWLFAVIRKTAISEGRKALLRSVISPAGTTKHATSNSGPARELERTEMQKRFQGALASLPPRQRETLHLVFYQDLSLREAAGVMGLSIGSARRHYERGKKRLREALDGKEADHGVSWRRTENPSAVL